jgi:hypothetical protein
MACADPAARWAYFPYFLHWKRDLTLPKDFIAFYNPTTHKTTKLAFENTYEGFEYISHGMDVVQSGSDPNTLFVYLVNHRPQRCAQQGKEPELGADSVIELFKTTVGGNSLVHVKTFKDSVIYTPNDITGSPDGDSFFFTNDSPSRTNAVSTIPSFSYPVSEAAN